MGLFGVSNVDVIALANSVGGRSFLCERPDSYTYWLVDTLSHPSFPGSTPLSPDQAREITQRVWAAVAGRYGMDRRPAKRLLQVAAYASDGKWYKVDLMGGPAYSSDGPF